jgi:type IV pilus assembly protein PilC
LSLPSRSRIATREFLVFNQELATLLKAGMPLVQSLDILRRRVTNPVFKSVLDDVHDRVRAGSALSEAFEAHGTLFPGVYTASLVAGEKSGNLEQVIRRYVAYVKVIESVRRKTISALIYPTVLLCLSLVVVAILVIVSVSNYATTYFGVVVLTLVTAAVLAWLWLKRPGNRERFDRWILSLPALGPIARKFATSQSSRTLATLLGGGIPLVNAIDVAARSISNRFMARELHLASQQVREGRSLAAAMSESGAFPDVALKMVEVGEQTGALQEMLNSLSDFYDEEIETSLDRFVTLVEPILLIIMGVVIAGLLLALYMPLFNLSNALR